MRKLLIFALPFTLGAGLCQYVLPERWQVFGASAALLAVLALACLWKDRRTCCAITAFGLAAGMLWFWCCTQLYLAPARALAGTEEQVTLELADYAEEQDYGTRTTVRVISRPLRGKAVYYGGNAMLELEPGERITVPAKYSSAEIVSGEESTYYTARGIFVRLSGEDGEMVTEPGCAGSARYLPQRLKRQLIDSVNRIFEGQTAAFVAALLTGEREGLDERSLADLQGAGLMHITAVSGLHCSFLVGLVGLLVGRSQLLTMVLGYPVLLGYMMVVGCTPSVVRSCVMLGLLMLAPLLGREGDTPTSLGAALLVILGINPFAVASASFQMSFGAVAGLLVVTPRLYDAFRVARRPRNLVVRALKSFVVSTVCASLGTVAVTAPLSAVYFRYVSLVSPLSNLLVLWAAPMLFACAFLTAAGALVFPGIAAAAPVTEVMVKYVLKVAELTTAVPGSALRFTTAAMAVWMLFVYAAVLLCWVCRVPRRTWALAAVLACLTLCAVRALPAARIRGGEMTVVAVDVGQGAATLIHSHGQTALVDCGSHYVSGGAGKRVAEVMDTYGWRKLDRVILTHYHADHAGGVEQLLNLVEVDGLLLPQFMGSSDQEWLQMEVEEHCRSNGVPMEYVDEMCMLPLGGAQLQICPPLSRGETNEEGLAVLAGAGDFEVLITGDMNAASERRLLEAWRLPDIEVLMVGHHGSRYSTSEELLAAVRPETAVISVGSNVYGHPTEDVLRRLARAGAEIYRTDVQGDVLIRVNDPQQG